MNRSFQQKAARSTMISAMTLGMFACDFHDDSGCRELYTPAPTAYPSLIATFEVITAGDGSFDAEAESFSVFVTNSNTVQQIRDLERGVSAANIPNGKLLDGAVEVNYPWTWHLDPEDIEMAEVTIEACDATPSYVEAHKAEFISTVGRYCPWSARLVEVEAIFEPTPYPGGCG